MSVKSKQRVADHGEVFTSERDVNSMLDPVEQEILKIESRFLEPACGDGNFLNEILRRKLAVIEARYKKSRLEYERYYVLAKPSLLINMGRAPGRSLGRSFMHLDCLGDG